MVKKQVAISVKTFSILRGKKRFDSVKHQVWLTLVNSTNQLYGAGGLMLLHFLFTADSIFTGFYHDINKTRLNQWHHGDMYIKVTYYTYIYYNLLLGCKISRTGHAHKQQEQSTHSRSKCGMSSVPLHQASGVTCHNYFLSSCNL